MRAPSFVLRLQAFFFGFGERFARGACSARGLVIAMAAIVLLTATAPGAGASASAGESTRERAEATFERAEVEDADFAFGAALAHYEEARAIDPGSARAPRAEARAATLRARAEDDFVPFTKLERVRRDAARASDPRAVGELLREAESFPPGVVRVEAWVFGAEALAHRFGRPGEAEALLRRVLVDAHTDSVIAQKAARDLVTLQLARGDLAGAREAVALAGLRADPLLGRDVKRAVRRRSVHHTSIGVLIAVIVLATRAWVGAARRGSGGRVRDALARTWKLTVAYAAYVSVGGALLAWGYEAGTTRPFLYFGVVLVPIVLVARAWAAAGGGSAAARGARAALCGAAAVGAGFLVLEAVDIGFLEGMGL